jgi:mono/diheme cytochrome c family protein
MLLGLLLGLLLSVGDPTVARADGDRVVGHDLAQRWCSECHIVDSQDNRGLADAPTFASLGRDPAKSEDYLTAFLLDPHPPMPKLELGRQDIEHLIAYIKSLK